MRFERRTVLEALFDLPHYWIVGRRNTEREASTLLTRPSHVARKMLSDDSHLILIVADELPAQLHFAHAVSIDAGKSALLKWNPLRVPYAGPSALMRQLLVN